MVQNDVAKSPRVAEEWIFTRATENLSSTRGLLATDHVILNHGQVTWTTPELAPPLLTTTPHQREDVSALNRFNAHRCPTRRVFSGTGLEPVTKQATVRYLYHSATAATTRSFAMQEKGGNRWCQVRTIWWMHQNFPTKLPDVLASHYRSVWPGVVLMEHNASSIGRFWSIASFKRSSC
ncbi:uncharacterized protein TNCV_3731821 [Trichonephila clavipes]|nr:uncharacterized protein TNCV_3731821 [Trichonephila clavipes]